MSDWFAQVPHGVRFDWGPAGAERLAPASACLVIVDVLSFSTSVTVAVEAGIRVFPAVGSPVR
jgi:2-phosphosulfolactate phosphatase